MFVLSRNHTAEDAPRFEGFFHHRLREGERERDDLNKKVEMPAEYRAYSSRSGLLEKTHFVGHSKVFFEVCPWLERRNSRIYSYPPIRTINRRLFLFMNWI